MIHRELTTPTIIYFFLERLSNFIAKYSERIISNIAQLYDSPMSAAVNP